MADVAAASPASAPDGGGSRFDLDRKVHPAALCVFLALLAGGVGYGVYGLFHDVSRVGEPLALGVFGLLGLALLIALGFEFVNGFHDTANAVATVIYTHSLPPVFAVIWSGAWNFIGVMLSSGAVAYSVITLLPVDLILQVGSVAGYAMIFSLLLAAVIWNLGTWWFGLPNSSSHALIGSILGVGLANQLLSPKGNATSGVEWGQAIDVFKALLFSPLIGFVGAAVLLLALKPLLKNEKLWKAPEGDAPPPIGIRSLLVFTCTAVSFAHGGNDGQKGMGLIMLILIGAAPTAYSLNRTMRDSETPGFLKASEAAQATLSKHAGLQPGSAPPAISIDDARRTVSDALRKHEVDTPPVRAALVTMSGDIAGRVKAFGGVRHTPAAATHNMRNDMYTAGDALRLITKDEKKLSEAYPGDEGKSLTAYRKALEAGTRFIPPWVKVAVAIALGLGTMVGWKRIVKTVGEKIGKEHLTYGQGAAAELVAAATILMAQVKGLPVSTTHILSSGVAGTMAANGSGLQWSTVRNIASAWVLTLPAAMAIAGAIYWALLTILGKGPV